MKKLPLIAGVILTSALVSSNAVAASRIFNATEGDWSVGTNWNSPGTVPGVDDVAFVRGNRTANVTSNVGAISGLTVANNSAGLGQVNLQAGSALTVSGNSVIGAIASGTGVLNVNGGLFTASGTTILGNIASSIGTLSVASGTFSSSAPLVVGSVAGGTGNVTVSGGNLTAGITTIGSGGAGTVTVSGGTMSVTTFTVSSQSGSVGSLVISGGRFATTASGNYFVGQRTAGTTTGSFSQSGGEVDLAGGGGVLVVGSSNGEAQTVHGSATISGGNFNGGFLIGGNTGVSDGTLTIQGSTAVIGSTSVSAGIDLRSTGKIVFQLDGVGVSTLDYANANVSFSTGADLWIDGSAYTGGDQIITLIDAGSFTNGDFATINQSVFGFGSGYTTNLFFDGNDLKLAITAVPEPSTWALLGLGLGAVLWQTRKRRMAKVS